MRAALAPLPVALALVCVTLSLGGCSLTHRHPEAPRASIPSGSAVPAPPADVLDIPDAVPRPEPRGTRGNPPFYDVFGKRYYVMASSVGWVERGTASWYGPGFHAASTSLGERYDMYGMTAAHKTLPLPAYAEVTNLRNGRKVVVRINDRGPFVGDRIIDLSYTAAAKLDMLLQGTAPVEVRVITPGATPEAAPDAAGSALPPATVPLPAAPRSRWSMRPPCRLRARRRCSSRPAYSPTMKTRAAASKCCWPRASSLRAWTRFRATTKRCIACASVRSRASRSST